MTASINIVFQRESHYQTIICRLQPQNRGREKAMKINLRTLTPSTRKKALPYRGATSSAKSLFKIHLTMCQTMPCLDACSDLAEYTRVVSTNRRLPASRPGRFTLFKDRHIVSPDNFGISK
ncbi:hypothetical protein CHS0354_026548 [Potamilus streckersoni]|uniref:Uncharacterized protein n=1 Tax=Potamilus streckersoni TaxID=2493646 RepID=A0AAE0RQA5_9BIVA|nr:hypothetical protein CHS0354_026548 [Potamilus streckersoni]